MEKNITVPGVIAKRSDLCRHYGLRGNANESIVSHCVYKYTVCGGWLRFVPGGVVVGTIVEGSDAEFMRELAYPFTVDEYESVWEEIESLADEAWHEANDNN